MKIKLTNQKELTIKKVKKSGNELSIVFPEQSVDTLDTIFASDSLSGVEVISDAGGVIGKYYNLAYTSVLKENAEVTVTLSFKNVIADVDVSQQLNEIQGELNALRQETANTQELQDAAIEELASIASTLSLSTDTTDTTDTTEQEQ